MVLSLVGTNTTPVSAMALSSIPFQWVTPPPQLGSFPSNLLVARPMFRDARAPFQLVFSMPMNNRLYPYGMPTSMMVGLQNNMSTYSDNAISTRPSYNRHNSFSLTINNMV